MTVEDSKRKKELEKKIKQYITLMKDIASEIAAIVAEDREVEYYDTLKDMIGAMDQAQQMIGKASYSFIAKEIADN
jgi:hypothetical protein